METYLEFPHNMISRISKKLDDLLIEKHGSNVIFGRFEKHFHLISSIVLQMRIYLNSITIGYNYLALSNSFECWFATYKEYAHLHVTAPSAGPAKGKFASQPRPPSSYPKPWRHPASSQQESANKTRVLIFWKCDEDSARRYLPRFSTFGDEAHVKSLHILNADHRAKIRLATPSPFEFKHHHFLPTTRNQLLVNRMKGGKSWRRHSVPLSLCL